MTTLWTTIPMALLAAGLLTFLFLRLQLHRISGAGRAAYIGGAVLIILVATWNVFTSVSDYSTWFVITAYPILSAAAYIVLAIGLGLVVVALAFFADNQRINREELEIRENRLGLLQTLQLETRASYQLLELLSLALREILLQTPERAGVTFLINRGKRQLILGATANLTKNEIANLEHFTLERNAVAQAIDLGDPMIAGSFELTDAKGMPVQSRFQSSLVLPLISGSEKIGAIVLLAEEPRSFSRAELLYLAPVTDWVAEKIRTTRLTRELSLARTELEQVNNRQSVLIDRLSASAQSLAGSGSLPDFCRQLVGLAGSSEVYLCGLSGSSIQVYGGTESLTDLTEQYRLTLTEALERRKPLIINHESTERDGHASIVRSSLVFPVVNDATDALLLRKDGGPFVVSDQDLRLLAFFGLLARFALQQRETSRRDLSRRLGFEKVIQLIEPPTDEDSARHRAGYFMRHLAEILPTHSQVITLLSLPNGSFSAGDAYRAELTDLVDLLIEPGEGLVGEAINQGGPQFVYGKRAVLSSIETFSPSSQQILHSVFGERRLPQMMAACPLAGPTGFSEVVLFFFYDLPENEKLEWERLLTLAVGLYALRSNLSSLAGRTEKFEFSARDSEKIAPLINQLNNHLSAVIGSADLAAGREEVSGELRTLLRSIVSEADHAAKLVKRTLVLPAEPVVAADENSGTVNHVVEAVLGEVHISGDLYMAGGRPRELDLKLGKATAIHFADTEVRSLFESVLNRFAAIASDEDVISIATYLKENFLYLDISRHRKNFPPVESVASFGDYLPADQAFQHRPSDMFLKPVSQGVCYFAADKTGPTPAYLSFKFPVKGSTSASQPSKSGRQVRVLAIDDQAVILDLISAMCQSLGYYVQTASSGSEGLRMASTGKFDIILTDLAMPDLTGLDVARQIRAFQPQVPIILVTGWEAGLDQSEIDAAGITEILLKPFRIEQLTDIIRSLAAKIG
ncbi:MAG: response regulator [bacterium]|nr:response regulator [bacterium]